MKFAPAMPPKTNKSFLVLFFKKEQRLLFEKRSKNFYSFFGGWQQIGLAGGIALLLAALPATGLMAQDSGFDAFPPDLPARAARSPARPAPPPEPWTQAPPTQAPATPAPPPPQAAPPTPAPDVWQARPVVELVGLDKVSARATPLSGPVGQPLTFGSLTVLPRACVVRPPDVPADAAAFLEIADTRLDTKKFSAWMLVSEPAVSIFEHPVYDIRLVGCRAAP
jgi:hypothetical protein